MVIKESSPIRAQAWTNEGVPEEVKMMRRMNKTDCHAVPNLIGYKRYVRVEKHRIYMEFCPHGDLEFLNIKYKRFWSVYNMSKLLKTCLIIIGPFFRSHSYGTLSTIWLK